MSWVRQKVSIESREAEEKKVSNTFMAAISPVDVRNGTFVIGSVSHVALEVLLSYIVRRLTGSERRGLLELTAIHALSIPLQGGLSAFADGAHPLYLEAPFGSLFVDGAKGIPAVFATTYMVNVATSGFHKPKLSFRDILITAASKIISRPIMGIAYGQLGKEFRNGQDAVEASFAQQRYQSILNQPDDAGA